jgi:hypothetical protein
MLYNELDELQKSLKVGRLVRVWTEDMNKAGGVFELLRQSVK